MHGAGVGDGLGGGGAGHQGGGGEGRALFSAIGSDGGRTFEGGVHGLPVDSEGGGLAAAA